MRRAGLISAAPGRRNGALQNSAKQVLALGAAWMACGASMDCCLWLSVDEPTQDKYDILTVPLITPAVCAQGWGYDVQVEGMVQAKMSTPEFIILCLEDSNDWSNATSRRMVMQVPLCNPPCYLSHQGACCNSQPQAGNAPAPLFRCRKCAAVLQQLLVPGQKLWWQSNPRYTRVDPVSRRWIPTWRALWWSAPS